MKRQLVLIVISAISIAFGAWALLIPLSVQSLYGKVEWVVKDHHEIGSLVAKVILEPDGEVVLRVKKNDFRENQLVQVERRAYFLLSPRYSIVGTSS